MFQNFSGWHFLIILAVVLLLFGAPKLPALARSLGQSMRIFKGEVRSMKSDGSAENSDAQKAGSGPAPAASTVTIVQPEPSVATAAAATPAVVVSETRVANPEARSRDAV